MVAAMGVHKVRGASAALLAKAMVYLLFVFALLAVLAAPLRANEPSIAPPSYEPEVNGVNVTTGKRRLDVPVLSVPAAPRLRFDTVSNALPTLTISISGEADTFSSSISVQAGASISESFTCMGAARCENYATGSAFNYVNFAGSNMVMQQGGTGATYHFNNVMSDNYTWNTPSTVRQVISHPSHIAYPDGEVITFTYDTSPYIEWTLHRITKMTSNLGYSINITYHSNVLSPNLNANRGWLMPAQATLVKDDDPSTPLAQFTYGAIGTNGLTITDMAGRTYQCNNCEIRQGAPIETGTGTTILPTETGPSVSVTGVWMSDGEIVTSIQNDGVAWSYNYENLQPNASFEGPGYKFDALNVSGPNGYSARYNIVRLSVSQGSSFAPKLSSQIDSLGRTTSFAYDSHVRLNRITKPEGDRVEFTYGTGQSIISKTTRPKPGSGLQPIVETKQYNQCGTQHYVLCFRPTAYIDGRGNRTDMVYDTAGRVIQRTDPADSSGVRRATYYQYSGTSFTAPSLVRVCSIGVTCGTPSELRTTYTYWGNTALPATMSQVSQAAGITLTTTFTYDNAGRLLSEDGPLPGTVPRQHSIDRLAA